MRNDARTCMTFDVESVTVQPDASKCMSETTVTRDALQQRMTELNQVSSKVDSTSAVPALPGEQRPDSDGWGRVEESTQELIWTRGFKTRRRLKTTRKNRRRRDTHTARLQSGVRARA